MRDVRIVIIWLCILTGCTPIVPAQTPPQLEATPGIAIHIDDEYVTAPAYRVNYPDGWRVIKNSPAAAPLMLFLASPDDTQLIAIAESPLDAAIFPATDQPSVFVDGQRTLSAATIYVLGRAPLDAEAAFRAVFDDVLRSLAAVDSSG